MQESDNVRAHDLGGRSGMGPIDPVDHQMADWEFLVTVLGRSLGQKGIRSTDAFRRAVEDLEDYASLSYHERGVLGNEALLIEQGLLTVEEIDAKVAELEKRWGSA
jgi:hypothetical protein